MRVLASAPHHQHLVVRAALHHLHAGLQRKHKSRAARRDVEAPRTLRANLVLHQAGGRGKHHVRRHRAHDDGLNFCRSNAARGETLLRGLCAHVAHAQPRRQLVPLADPRALHDPLVAGLHYFFKVFIGDHIGRDVGSERRDFGAPAHDGANGKAQCISPCTAPATGGDTGSPQLKASVIHLITEKNVPGDLLHTHEPVTVASFRTWRGWRDYVA